MTRPPSPSMHPRPLIVCDLLSRLSFSGQVSDSSGLDFSSSLRASRGSTDGAQDWSSFGDFRPTANGCILPARIQDGGYGDRQRDPGKEEVKRSRPEDSGPIAPGCPLSLPGQRGPRPLSEVWPRKATSSSGNGARSYRAGE